jgi:hypothetical protein
MFQHVWQLRVVSLCWRGSHLILWRQVFCSEGTTLRQVSLTSRAVGTLHKGQIVKFSIRYQLLFKTFRWPSTQLINKTENKRISTTCFDLKDHESSKLLLALASTVTLGSESYGTHGHIRVLLSDGTGSLRIAELR